MTLTARPRFLIRFAVLAAMALCGIVLALSSTGTPPVGAQDGSAPAKPTGVVTTATHDSVALAWDDPSDASITHYQIFRRDRDVHDAGEFVTITENTGSAAASYTDDTVEPETRYVYRVKAVNQHGASTWSDFVRADTPAAPDPADLAPSGLEVSLVENRVTLTWDAPASDAASVTGYEILRRRPNDGEAALTTLVADTGNAETGYTDDTANEPGVSYTYRVRALRDGEQSKVSNFARIDLPDDYAQDTPEPEEEPTPEALAPSGLTAEAAEDGGVALSWTAPAEDAGSVTGYEVLRGQGSAALATLAADTGNTDTTYTDSGVTGDLDGYRYQVKALRGGDASQGSNVAGVLQSAHAGAIVPLADVTLVSNVGQTAVTGAAQVSTTQSQAQGFTTGSDSGGYTLGSVELAVSSFSGTASDITVSIYSESSGHPGTVVHTLTTPASISAAVTTFTAPSGATLAASTTYYVVISTTGSGISLGRTNAAAEDTGGVSGWSIADFRRFLGGSGWNITTNPIRMRVNGDAATSTNSPATGAPTITGTAQVGELLTADISNIGDSDGIADADFEYQWIAFDGTTDSDISGATGETYRPLLAHLAQTIKVRVTFDDDDDNAESLTSTATAAVSASTYGQVIWAATLTVEEETVAAGTFFGYSIAERGSLEPNVFTHVGVSTLVTSLQYIGDQLRFYLSGDPLGSEDFNLYLDGAPFLIESPGTVGSLSFSDHGLTWTDEQEVEVRLTVNRPATGAPAITGKPEVGETLTADISGVMDEDGLPVLGQLTYQWISNDGTDDSDIDGATDSTYTLMDADEGKTIKVRVSFTDNAKFPESLTSAAVTVPVAALVSNVGQTAATGAAQVNTPQSQGQGFTTGSDSGGYTLGSVELAVSSFSGAASDITVSIYSESSGNPGTVVHTLTTPASISAAVTTFTAPSGATLAASTTYYVVISTTSSGISLSRTNATAEDTGGVSGWSIADSRRFFGLSGWNTTTNPIRMRVNGDAATSTNSPATGAPTISGTAQVGELLTADISNIGDSDGVADADFEYQWIANDGTDDSDISGATGETYRPLLAHLDQTIKVRVTFDDDNDNAESLTSAPTAVTASTYGQVIWSATLTVEEYTVSGTGTFFGYSLFEIQGSLQPTAFVYLGSDRGSHTVSALQYLEGGTLRFDFLGALGSADFNLYLDGAPFLIESPGGGTSLSFSESFSDHGLTWTDGQEVEVRLTVNRPATGAPAITGKPEVGETLTADISGIMDEDGLPVFGELTYQWISNDGTDDSDIDGATDSTYAVVQADEGKTIKVRVSFTDNANFPESLTSAATTAVTGALVSNVGQTAAGNVNVTATQSQGQGFTTGSESGGYTLGSVELAVSSFSGTASDITVSIYSESSGDPGTLVHTLTTPASISTPVTTFTAPSGTTLAAGTTYYVVISTTSSGINLSRTNTTAEDTGGASGWSIADDRRFFGGGNWVNTSSPIRMRVNGATATTSTAIWSATLTVAEFTIEPNTYRGYTHVGTAVGELDPSTFSHDGDEITVNNLWHIVGGLLTFEISQELGGEGFLLRLGETLLPLGEPTGDPPVYQFSDHGVSWSVGDTVEVRLIPNQAATGAPVITGTPEVSQTLTADTDGIGDPDGIDNADFSYQWVRNDDSDIDGATDSTYTLVFADYGNTIKVRVSFTDDNDFPESLTSTAVAVASPYSDVIHSALLTVGIGAFFSGYSSNTDTGDLEPADFTHNGNPAVVQVLAYIGNEFHFQTSPALGSGNYGLILDDTPIQLGAASGSPARHQVSDHGLTWTVDQQVEVWLVLNNAPTGEPVITGTPEVSQTLTTDISGIMDTDGRPADDQFSYQWIRNDGTDDSDISGATNATYELGSADLDKTIKVRVTFTDGGGFPERLTSDATGPVTPLTVSSDWSLVPSGLGPGDRFRLLFISSGGRNARPTSIDTYNTWIQNLAAAGHTDIQIYSSSFRVVGSTADVDARDNTGTTYTSSDKGVAIYWLNGNKVADQYQDFYDGSWAEEASMRNQSGSSVSAPNPSTGVWTGSAHDGTEGADSMGDSVGFTTIGKPNSGGSGDGPLRSNTSLGSGQNKKLYGLSGVFEVDAGSNTPATGKPTISGTPQVNQTLTAGISAIMDEDGLPAADQFSYQWIRNDSDIDGATDSTYTLVEADAGKTITVRVSFTDSSNYPESLTSAATATVLEMGVTEVPSTWSLIPSGLGVGDEFRLLFVSSTTRNAASTSISTYNTWIQNRAAAGHTDIQDYSSTFAAVGCTAAVDARDNTKTTYTSSDKGLPIYWLNGNKVVDEYEDFYDGDWDDQANPKTEAGSSTSATAIWTGCDEDGTESFTSSGISRALGKEFVALGSLNHATLGPVGDSAFNGGKNGSRPLYGLSGVFHVVPPPPTVVPADWSLIPSGLVAGQEFRLLFLSSTKRSIRSTNISDYNTFVQNRAAAGHTDIQDYSDTFRVLGSTGAVDARDNTWTTYTSSDKGVRIYWLNGDKAADQYEDFYDGSWNQQADAWNESGVEYNLSARRFVATGSSKDGTADQSNPLGASSGEVQLGCLYQTSSINGPVSCNFTTENIGADDNQQLYGLSGVFRVTTNNATGKPVITGTPEVNQTLTADISGIMDEDGLPAADQFSYQWIRSDGTDDSDISGATDSTYKVKAADQGKTIKVRVTFTDGGGTEETLTSDATAAVAADTTGPVVKEVSCGAGGFACTLVFDELLDVNPDHRPSTNSFAVTADGTAITVGIVFPLIDGELRLSSLAPQIYQGQSVTVIYTDPTAGNDVAAIQDEAGNDAASFTTGEDGVPAVTNNSTVEPPTGALVSNKNRTIENAISRTTQAQSFVTGPSTGGYMLSKIQIRLGDDSTLPGVNDLIAAIKVDDGSGEPGALVANLANPASLTNDALNTFTAPTGTVLAPDTTYWVVVNEERGDSADWVNLRVTAQDEEDEALPGWSIGNNHLSKVSASGSWNHGATVSNLIVVSGSVVVGTADTTGPVVEEVSCGAGGFACTLVFDELLDVNPDHRPSTNSFAVTADGTAITVGIVFPLIDGELRLSSLAPQIYQGQSVTVIYTDPTAGNDVAAIQDEAGNDAASFTTGEDDVPAVTNNSTVAPVAPDAPTGLTATASGGTQIDLAWTAPADNGGRVIDGYQIEYSDDAGTSWSVLVADTQSTDTIYSDTTLSGGDTRHYRVSAINSIDTGAASTVANATTVTQPAVTLVSNAGQTALDFNVPGLIANTYAQEFTTGTNSTGYNLGAVELLLGDVGLASVVVSLYSSDSGTPGSSFFTFTNPASITADAANSFSAPAGTVLAASTSYFIVATGSPAGVGSNVLSWTQTFSDNEDSGGASGWSIGNNRHQLSGSTWSTDVLALRIAVSGSLVVGPPDAPTNVLASGNAELTVTWDAPDNGGSAITGYTVQWKSGTQSYNTSRQATVTTTTHTIPSLTNDTTYTLRVKATNANGDSGWTETTATPLSGPGVGSVTVDQATITQTGADVTVTVANLQNASHTVFLRYRVEGGSWPAAANQSTPTSGTAVTFTLSGLTGNTDYDVAASLDSGFASGVKTAAFTTSPTKPGQTWGVNVTLIWDGSLTINWVTPLSDGGSAITGYKVQWKSGSQSFGDPSREHTTGASASTYVITGLTNGTEYTVRVIAVNAVGDGPPSSKRKATPVGPPDAPPNVQAGSGHQQLTVSWGAPNDGGSAITEYTLQWKSGGQSFISSRQRTIAAPSRTDTIPSLDNGTEYTVRVRATNALGDSGWSAQAKGTPREGPHVSTVKVKEPISCTVTFVALDFVNLEAATEYQAHLRFRAQGSASWTVLSPRGFWSSGLPSGAARGELNGPSPAFTLTDLAYETIYEVQAALDSGFVDGLAATTFSTPNLSEAGLMPLSPGDGTLVLRMTRPTSEGRVDGYLLQWKSGDEEYDDTDTSERQADVPGPGDREYTITGLDNGVEYTVRAMAYNDNGVGVPSSEVRGTPEAPPNSPARGAPTISGTAQVGETLTADTDGIEDDDGLADAVYSYQWLADDADIAGATSDTYTPVADDVGKAIKLKVSFRDDRNHQESLTSEPTAAVAPRPNSPATGAPTISGTVRVGETLTAETRDIEDADGMSGTVFSYQWLANGADVAGATNETYTPVADDVGKAIKVKVSFRDDRNHQESLTSAATAAVEPRPNSPATGAPTISGTAQVGKTLTADTSGIDDADGMSGAVFSYQWLANGADVAGATNETYTPVADDVGKAIKVKVSFRDDRNHQESLTSAATAAVTAAADDSSIWSATLTVGSIGGFRGFWKDIGMGELTSEVFTLDGVDYTVKVLADSDGPQFYLTLDKALPAGFTLQVGATTLSSQDASIREFSSGATQYGWATNQEAVLADVDTVEVSLTLAE